MTANKQTAFAFIYHKKGHSTKNVLFFFINITESIHSASPDGVSEFFLSTAATPIL